jgi:hypothetical protein
MADKRTFLQFIFFQLSIINCQLSIGSFQLSLFTLFFGAKKRDKRNIHPNPSFPYMGRLNRIPELARLPVAFPPRRSYTKVSSPHQRGGLFFFVGLRNVR